MSHRRVTSPVQHEVALNDSVHDGPAGVYAGPDLPVGWEKGGRDGSDDELGVARRDEESLGVSPVEQAPLVVHQRHAPELAVEGGVSSLASSRLVSDWARSPIGAAISAKSTVRTRTTRVLRCIDPIREEVRLPTRVRGWRALVDLKT